MKYYLIAGERSGDLHGGNLVESISALDAKSEFRGFGGDEMKQRGVEIDRHYKDLAFMGFIEVLLNLSKISKFLKEAKSSILEFQPDVVILIDYGGFNLKIASFLRKNNIRCYYYITPKVWAWNRKRAWKIKRLVDRMFVILPFEKDFYKKYNWEVDYVGNPVLDAIKKHDVVDVNINNKEKDIVAVLPGSRVQEVKNVISTICNTIKQNDHIHFVIAKVDNIDQSIYGILDGLENVEFFTGETYNLLAKSKAAIVTSGTATLETALLSTPQVVVYRTSRISYWIGRMVIQIGYISLVNLIANKKVVTELIQDDFNTARLNKELQLLLKDDSVKEQILDDYQDIKKLLDIGSASKNTAKLIVKYLQVNT